MGLEAFFLPVGNGKRFCLFDSPAGAVTARAAVVYVHPFAEEMNKSRRMATLQTKALVDSGCAVLRMDLRGCGDSDGDFGDAGWSDWCEDVYAACRWLAERCKAPLWIWGLRAGCLLAVDAAARMTHAPGLLFWQPVLSGKQHLQQFLRLRVAGAMLGGDSVVGESTSSLQAQLEHGESIEVAGYLLNPALARGLSSAELRPILQPTRVVWLEVAAKAGADVAPASQKRIDAWHGAGHRVAVAAVIGPTFWQTTEIEVCDALLEATVRSMFETGTP